MIFSKLLIYDAFSNTLVRHIPEDTTDDIYFIITDATQSFIKNMDNLYPHRKGLDTWDIGIDVLVRILNRVSWSSSKLIKDMTKEEQLEFATKLQSAIFELHDVHNIDDSENEVYPIGYDINSINQEHRDVYKALSKLALELNKETNTRVTLEYRYASEPTAYSSSTVTAHRTGTCTLTVSQIQQLDYLI